MKQNIEQLKEISKLYKDIASIMDEMIAHEESGIEDENKEALLAGKLFIRMMELEAIAK